MKATYTFYLLLFSVFFHTNTFANWTPVSTGINDNLNDIYFWSENIGVAVGNRGIYFTISGTDNAGAWKRFSIPASTSDKELYDRCRFLRMEPDTDQSSFKMFICAYDTVYKKAVLFSFKADNQALEVIFTGETGSRLNDICISTGGFVLGVGENGLIIKYDKQVNDLTILPKITDKHLHAAAVDYYRDFVNIGGDGIFLKAYVGKSALESVVIKEISYTITDIQTNQNGNGSFAIGPDGYYKIPIALFDVAIAQVSNYNYGQLNPSRISVNKYGRSASLVATTHGIFRQEQDALEYQPLSGKYALNSVCLTEVEGLAFACGKNGLVLKTINGGGGTIPYLNAVVQSYCVSETVRISRNSNSSANSCTVRIFDLSGKQVYSSLNSCAFVLSLGTGLSKGRYRLLYSLSNGIFSDSIYADIEIPEIPSVNLPVISSDEIFCREGRVNLKVSDTQPGWDYLLYAHGSEQPLGVVAGNGNIVSFDSDVINTTGKYYIRVKHQNSACFRNFTDTINILVEHPESRLVAQYINGFVGERVNFKAISNDASYFSWKFDNSAAEPEQSGTDISTAFAQKGEKQVQLISTSKHGCSDTAVLKAVTVVAEEGLSGTCFNHTITGEDFGYNSSPTIPLMAEMKLQNDGILVGGTAYRYYLKSAVGDTLPQTEEGGALLVKYSNKGTLRWRWYSKYSDFDCPSCTFTEKPCIYGIETGEQGDVIISGRDYSGNWFYSNSGDSVQIASPRRLEQGRDELNGFVARFDNAGKLLWRGTLIGAYPKGIKQDRAGNFWVLCSSRSEVYYYKNGTQKIRLLSEGRQTNALLIKISAMGDYLLSTPVNNTGVDIVDGGISDLVIDKENNVWIIGEYRDAAELFNGNGLLAARISRPSGFETLVPAYLAKYDGGGNYLMHINILRATEGARSFDISANNLAVDSLNNIYVLGNAAFYNASFTDSVYFIHSSGTSHAEKFNGGFYLLKLSPDGKRQWISTSSKLDNGRTTALMATAEYVYVATSSLIPPENSLGVINTPDGASTGFGIDNASIMISKFRYNGELERVASSGGVVKDFRLKPVSMLVRNENFYLAGEKDAVYTDNSTMFFNQSLNFDKIEGAFFTALNNNFCYNQEVPVGDAGKNKAICRNTSTTIGSAAIAGNTYYWTSMPGGFFSSEAMPTVAPLVSTIYYLSVTNKQGYIFRDSVLVDVSGPQADAGLDITICKGDTAVLGKDITRAEINYYWTSSQSGFRSDQPTLSVHPDVSTYFVLHAADLSGCFDQDTVWVNIDVAQVNAGTDTTVCRDEKLTLGTMNGTTDGYRYSWRSVPAGFASDLPNPMVAVTGNITYHVIATNNNQCIAMDSVVVELAPSPVVYAGADTTICAGDSVLLGSGLTSEQEYFWTSYNEGWRSSDVRPLVGPVVSTSYLLKAVSIKGCVASDSVTITVTNPPARPSLTVDGDLLRSSANTGNQWFLDDTLINNATENTYKPLISGVYAVRVMLNRCVSQKSDTIHFNIYDNQTDAPFATQVNMGPVPATDMLLIRYTGNANEVLQAQITSFTGEMLINKKFKNELHVNMRAFGAGMYIVNIISTDGRSLRRKVIKL